jgi:hypothetical protein
VAAYTGAPVRRDLREVIADWLILLGAIALLVALFLPWSRHGRADQTAWQVYSIVDVGLALLAAGLAAVAMIGGRVRRLVLMIASGVALAFAVHAHVTAPTDGADVYATAAAPRPGAGETVAIVGLAVALAGVVLSFTAD